ncbi:MAG: hypothetical protein ACOH19_15695 [Rhodoglobus sp.]
MDILHSAFLALHLLGLAGIIGSFFVQMKRKSDFVLWPTLVGAIVQLVSGLALVGIAEAGDHDLNYAKIAVKAVIAVIVLGAAISAVIMQRKGGKVQPFFHAAGGFAVINLLVAVFWN